MRTSVYIDGFNFYYWLKPTPYRWIDLKSLAAQALSHPQIRHDITAVKYFTARVSSSGKDPLKDLRQNTYLQALNASTPGFKAYFGEFRRKRKWMRLVTHIGGAGNPVQVWSTEEKGSDVNLAVELMNDACNNAFDLAVVVSNDSDLVRALTLIKRRGKRVGVLVRGDAQVVSLRKASHFQVRLRENDLRRALLPLTIPNTHIRIPEKWRAKEQIAQIR